MNQIKGTLFISSSCIYGGYFSFLKKNIIGWDPNKTISMIHK